MVIKNAAFVTSLERYGNYPGIGLPEIAVAGKSNVGKSSMINKLCATSWPRFPPRPARRAC